MARKKQEAQLLREIETQEEWDDIMAKEGLWVVDVFQEWAGPCEAMVSNFRRIKNELGDDLLHFAMAKADSVETLEKYRGSCEPCFLYFAAGVLVAFVHGANAPLILRTLTEQLAQEHKCLEGTAERKEVKDPFIQFREAESSGDKEEEEEEKDGRSFEHRGELVIFDDELTPAEEYEEVEQGYTVAIIKPNAVAEGKVEEILAEMRERGIEPIAQEERHLTADEAREFYSHLADQDFFEDLVSFMSSGPSHLLVLTKGKTTDETVIKDWREMLGPTTVEEAKEEQPESLRAKYGHTGMLNALHGSDCKETAARELAFFFPHMHAPTIQVKKKEIERTLALIRPDAFAAKKDEILERIKEAGFRIALEKEVHLTKEKAEEFYREHEGQPYFDTLTTNMSSGPLLALGLAREDAIDNWRTMLGPKEVDEAKTIAPESLRAEFALETSPINQLHGSDTKDSAKREMEFFFPVEQTIAVIKPEAMGTKEAIIDKIHEAGFKIAARKEVEITRSIAESFYEDQKDKAHYKDLVDHMTSGPTMFMVLSREDAVHGWREVIGPTDPEQAKEENPESIRAQFGTDKLHNAVHGCTSKTEVVAKIGKIFGDLEFNSDGTVKGEGDGDGDERQAERQPEAREQEQHEQQQQEQQSSEQQEQPSPEQLEQGTTQQQEQQHTEQQEQQPTEQQEQQHTEQQEQQPTEQQEQDQQEQRSTEEKREEAKPSEQETKPDEQQQEDSKAEERQQQDSKAEEQQQQDSKAEEHEEQEADKAASEQQEERRQDGDDSEGSRPPQPEEASNGASQQQDSPAQDKPAEQQGGEQQAGDQTADKQAQETKSEEQKETEQTPSQDQAPKEEKSEEQTLDASAGEEAKPEGSDDKKPQSQDGKDQQLKAA